jgi:hypothetical protein
VLAESDPHPLCNQCGARRGLQDVSATAANRLVGGRVMGHRELLDDPNAREARAWFKVLLPMQSGGGCESQAVRVGLTAHYGPI